MSAASHSHTCLSDGRMRSTIDNGPMRACRSSVSSHPSYAAPKRMDRPFCFGRQRSWNCRCPQCCYRMTQTRGLKPSFQTQKWRRWRHNEIPTNIGTYVPAAFRISLVQDVPCLDVAVPLFPNVRRVKQYVGK
jgi:hypothetical protein